MPARVPVGNGKYCYTGPTCTRHAAHWEHDAEAKLAQANTNLLAAQDFDDFKQAKAAQVQAQADYDITEGGHKNLRQAAGANPTDNALQERLHAAETIIKDQHAAAVHDFVTATPATDRAADVFTTTDKEKLGLYAQDPDADVRANLALNPAATGEQLKKLAAEHNERIQANVALNPSATTAVLNTLNRVGVNDYVKTLAKAQLGKRATAKRKAAEEAERDRQAAAARYSSYAYRGKGGGK